MLPLKIDSRQLKEHFFQLQTTNPNAPTNDLKPLAAMLGSASLVGMGEATHGSKEFTLIRHRMLKFMVEEMGFKGLILETPEQPARAIDTYIKTGEGNAHKLLDDLGYWVHNTQEILNVIQWMREYNQLHPSNLISFYGCDISSDDERRYQTFSIRDKAMAENCLKILDGLGGNARLALWSHNFHICHPDDLETQGSFLKKMLGDNYFAYMSLFNEGGFNAFLWDTETERTNGFKAFSLDAAREGSYEYVFAQTGQPLAIFDIGKVKNRASLHNQLEDYTIRDIGSVFIPDNPKAYEYKGDLLSQCEGIIWIQQVTAATALWQKA